MNQVVIGDIPGYAMEMGWIESKFIFSESGQDQPVQVSVSLPCLP